MTLIKTINHQGVEGARFGKYNLADNSTAVVYKIGDTLIDTGPPNQWRDVRSYLSEKTVRQVLLTHHHEDHSGNGARISNHFNIPVFIHEKGLSPVENGFPLRLYQKIFWGRPKKKTLMTMPLLIQAGNGYSLEPIHTPGHSPDHMCFFEPEKKWLFTGDLFLAVRPKLFRADEHLAGEIDSLKTILKYDFKTIFCAHKGIVQEGYTALQKKLDYFLELIETVRKMSLRGNTEREITRHLFGKRDVAGLVSFKHICCKNLVNQCLKVSGEL